MVIWDLFLHDIEQGKSEKLTTRMRMPPAGAFHYPTARWSPDNHTVAFMQYGDNQARGNKQQLEIWTIDVDQKPTSPMPLSSGFADILLDWR